MIWVLGYLLIGLAVIGLIVLESILLKVYDAKKISQVGNLLLLVTAVIIWPYTLYIIYKYISKCEL